MNKELFKKMAGIISALSITASSVMPAAAQAVDTSPEYDDIVHVIVELYGDPILAADTGDMGADYLDTAAAQARSQQLENLRHNAFGEILSIYPDAEFDFTYDAVFNGFSCTLPRELIDEAEDLAAIKNVTESHYNQKPELYEAVEGTGTYRFSSETGLTGEGKVIAVIDTELKTDHEMFAPLDDSLSVKLTKQDITNTIKKRGLNFKVNPNLAYLNSKIPYAVSLVDEENRYTVANDSEEMYHGTHVCGIAAGDRVQLEDGTEMSGVAPDAQLIFMAGFTQMFEEERPGISDEVAVAGIEDAVKLGADIVSLSFGAPGMDEDQNKMYDTVIQNANNAGVVICAAAGNEGWPQQAPENVDRCTLDSPGQFNGMFTIAAAEVYTCGNNKIKLADGTPITCAITSHKTVNKDTEYEYVFCGTGSEEELKAANIKGKVAVVEYDIPVFSDDFDFDTVYNTVEAAEKAGAAGVIFCSNEEDDYICPICESENFFVIGLAKEGTELIKAQEDHRILFRTDVFDNTYYYNMADFTSHGTRQALDELKPDIAAPGVNVYSASYDGYNNMDGTSMATPFAAGCSALAAQYIESKGWNVSGGEKVSLVKNLLMNTADPVCESDIPYSPRIQGAGLVNMTDLSNCTVTMTHNGKASVCLGSMVGDTFSFDVTLHNYGSEKVVFKKANVEMVHENVEFDDFYMMDLISDTPAVLGSSAKYSVKKAEIPAGGELSFTVTVTLDANDVNELNSMFTNGWFTDGYLTLSGAENCCDISIPITGFHGDWSALPIIGKDYAADNTEFSENILRAYVFYCNIPASTSLAYAMSAYKNREDIEFFPDAEPTPRHGYVISPNVSTAYGLMNYNITPLRNGVITNVSLTDEKGNEVYSDSSELNTTPGFNDHLTISPSEVLKNGKYILEITSKINSNDNNIKPQKNSIELTIDNDPPVLSNVSVKKENGRKILTVTAQDPELEGFYIVGNGKGCVKGESDNNGCSFDDFRIIIQNLDPYSQYYGPGEGGGVGSYGRNTISSSATISDVVNDVMFEGLEFFDYDFLDAVPAEPDENGCMTLKYDVTDLKDYTLSVADRGYNVSTYSTDLPVISNIPGITEVKSNTLVSELTLPTYTFKGKVTSEGWEYYNTYAGEWVPFEKGQKLEQDFHGEQIKYAVHVGDKVAYSNPTTVSITDVLRVNVSIYENGELVYSKPILRSSFGFISYDFKDDANYRVVMEADGYVTKILEFKGFENIPYDSGIDLYQLGDINGDRSINVTDITKVAAHIKGRRLLDDYQQKVADINHDGRVNVTDIIKIAAHIKGKRLLS
ncbi:MAG: S8 family serine peptidase [Ruminococcus sp.]|uniref:S8 family serine peptidase n=1 Tax=Ruminococcus sp. TaxID=41978 RepID=UPI0025E37499|nr:S8 family serine peptidase [Ruminococcus sp.]MCR5541340.1 S8 family serine peptidase [Ruminococcus sp.]